MNSVGFNWSGSVSEWFLKAHHATYFVKEMEKVADTKASEMRHLIITKNAPTGNTMWAC